MVCDSQGAGGTNGEAVGWAPRTWIPSRISFYPSIWGLENPTKIQVFFGTFKTIITMGPFFTTYSQVLEAQFSKWERSIEAWLEKTCIKLPTERFLSFYMAPRMGNYALSGFAAIFTPIFFECVKTTKQTCMMIM